MDTLSPDDGRARGIQETRRQQALRLRAAIDQLEVPLKNLIRELEVIKGDRLHYEKYCERNWAWHWRDELSELPESIDNLIARLNGPRDPQ